MDNLSLLDWLKAKLSTPSFKRWTRFGLALAAALWGALLLASAGKNSTFGYLLFGLAFGFLVWAVSTRGASAAPAGMPEFNLAARPAVSLPARPAFPAAAVLSGALLPGGILLAVVGQLILTYNRTEYLVGLFFYGMAILTLGWVVWKQKLLGPARAEAVLVVAAPKAAALRIRWLWVGVAFVTGGVAFWASRGNQFRPEGVLAWGVSLAAWLLAVWQTDFSTWRTRLTEGVQALARAKTFRFGLSRATLILVMVLGIGAYFRYASLDTIPPEMTSDHVEKLLDVNDILQGNYKIYFERNTGREPLEFYLAVLTLKLLGTGLTHLTLKIVTATAGLLTLPFVYLLGREVEDETLGLLAALLAAISFWATAISRVGLRFPLYPLFVAPVLYFLVRGLRRGTRNDFLLAGLFLGLGLNGYSPFKFVPVLVIAAVAWFALWPQAKGQRGGLLANMLLLFVTAFILCLPLARYALEPNNIFWYRTGSRLTGEYGISAPATALALLKTFIINQWNALKMFNWLGDRVWVNTIPDMPALDFISGALLILGVAFGLFRLVFRRDWVAGLWFIALPILMLPSTLSVAFPEENPSVVRTSGAIPVVFILAAYPFWLLLKHLKAQWPGALGRGAGLAALVVVVGGAAAVNQQLYFEKYPEEYLRSAQNASEIGLVIHDFARTIGSYDTAVVRPYPFWVDTRAVGMYAQGGVPSADFGREFAIQYNDLARLQPDPRPKLFILNRLDYKSRPDGEPPTLAELRRRYPALCNVTPKHCVRLPTLAELRRLYPEGKLSLYPSKIEGHDFLIFFVPGAQDLTTGQLPNK